MATAATCLMYSIFLFYSEFYFISYYIRQDSWPYVCKSDEEKARKEMSAINVSYCSFLEYEDVYRKGEEI